MHQSSAAASAEGDDSLPLFRKEAINKSRVSNLGEIILIRPLSAKVLAASALLVTIGLIAVLVFGSYTRRIAMKGQLMPRGGVARVVAPEFGVILEKHVEEGQHVKKGDILYVLTSDRSGAATGSVQADLIAHVQSRKASLLETISDLSRQEDSERLGIQEKIAYLNESAAQQKDAITVLTRRVALADQMEARYEDLGKQGYISKIDLVEKQADMLDQKGRLQSLERDALGVKSQMQDQRSQLQQLPLRYDQQRADLERELASTEQELTQDEMTHRWTLEAPTDGVASAVIGEVGQTVDAQRPILSVVPESTILDCILYAPSKAVGFIRKDQQVYLRFDAFPYEKFGHQRARVVSVARTAVAPGDLTESGTAFAASAAQGTGESVYQITVRLESQTILAYGKPEHLQAGMLVDADVLQESRRLYEWALEPLTAAFGRVKL